MVVDRKNANEYKSCVNDLNDFKLVETEEPKDEWDFNVFRDLSRHAFPGAAAAVAAKLSKSLNELFGRFNSLISKKEYFMSVLLNGCSLHSASCAVAGHHLSHSPQKRKQKWILSTQP